MVEELFHAGRKTRATSARVLVAGPALLLVTAIGCSSNRGPTEVTTVVFDGQPQTFTGSVTCTTQPNGKLVILASADGQKTVRVLLSRENRLVVEKVGLHLPGATGFIDDSDEVFATKVDDTYTINGRIPPNAGETAWHQFEVEAICRFEVPVPVTPAHNPHVPRIP